MDSRVSALRDYLVSILNDLGRDFKQLNINFLPNEPENYTLYKMPVMIQEKNWIIPGRINKDVYNFGSRFVYGSSLAENMSNQGFWEAFEHTIYTTNENKIFPNISGIQEIKCLNPCSVLNADTGTCEMSIQIQINYLEV